MKKIVLLLIISTLVLTGCFSETENPQTSQIPIPPTSTEETKAESNSVSIEESIETSEVSEESQVITHSPLYIENLLVEDLITYFNEVCLDAEFVNGGNATVIQKWKNPIIYRVKGNPTDEDLEVLEDVFEYLKIIDGMPEIREAKSYEIQNLTFNFVDNKKFLDIMGNDFVGCDGGVTYWYTNNIINESIIGIRTDIPQTTRSAVIIEEIYNGLGATQDTALRPDSIIYCDFNSVSEMSEIDKLILTLLYDENIKVGMNADECETVIRNLYY